MTTPARGPLPFVAHVPMALSTQGATLMTVTQRLGEAYTALGGRTLTVLSRNRDLTTPGLESVYVDYTENCPREWFTKTERGVDIAAGALGLERPHFGTMYDPAIRAVEQARPDVVLLYEGHYASATLPRWKRVRETSELCLYVHNPLSRSYCGPELRRLLGAADRVIFCADHLRRNVEKRLAGARVTTLETVHNGIDERFRTAAPRTDVPDEFGVLFFGRVGPNKGVHLALRAAARAAGRTRRPVRMRIVGSAAYQADGALSDYEQQLRDEADAMEIPVEFIPFVPPEKLVEIMRESSVACLPSTWAEGFPLAALEAMATGLPVICSDSPGMLEACADAAIIAPMDEVEPLVDGMLSLAEDDAAWRERSAAGWTRAQGFSWERTMRDIVRLPAPAGPVTP